MTWLATALQFLAGDAQADRVVPPTGFTARLTLMAAGAMAFLAVFTLALSLAAGRLASEWSSALARSATIRVSAPADQMEAQVKAVLDLLATTPGVASARALDDDEEAALLAPWFGPDLPLDTLPVPRLIEVTEAGGGYDREGLAARLAGEAPGAVLDDHTRWRAPLLRAASRMRALGWLSLLLIAATNAAIITLAANAALAANERVIRTLRLIGARDSYIARAFVRRYTLRAFFGAGAGMALGMLAIALMPGAGVEGSFLTGLGFRGWHWLLPFLIPPLAGAVAFFATRATAMATLRERS